MKSEIKIVNIVASGQMDCEIDLKAVYNDLNLDTKYIKGPGLYFKFTDNSPTIVISRTGKYIISGAKSEQEARTTREDVLDLFEQMGILKNSEDRLFSIKNIVFTSDLGFDVDLSAAAIHLGLEEIEYEPEQFPGLIYRPEDVNAVALIFGTGKVVITGVREKSVAKKAHNIIARYLKQINNT